MTRKAEDGAIARFTCGDVWFASIRTAWNLAHALTPEKCIELCDSINAAHQAATVKLREELDELRALVADDTRGVMLRAYHAFRAGVAAERDRARAVVDAARKMYRSHQSFCGIERHGECTCGREALDEALAAHDAAVGR